MAESEIPDRVRQLAKGLLCQLADMREQAIALDRPFWSAPETAEILSRSILAERERCAKIAETTDPNAHDIAAGIRQDTPNAPKT